jgi:hypothetical protein
LNQIFQRKFTEKSLVLHSKKCKLEDKAEELKVKKAIKKGNMDGAWGFIGRMQFRHNEQLNCSRIATKRGMQSKIQTTSKPFITCLPWIHV